MVPVRGLACEASNNPSPGRRRAQERTARVTFQSARPPPLVLMIYAPDGGGYGEYLAASGFRVAEVQTGKHGFEQAVTLLPDLIVLDFGLDGDLVGRLRRETTTSAIPIIALTDISNLRAHGAGEGHPAQSGPAS